ncbi:hypothetical protein MHYP_G00036020 [Metynnis hypsauchen]
MKEQPIGLTERPIGVTTIHLVTRSQKQLQAPTNIGTNSNKDPTRAAFIIPYWTQERSGVVIIMDDSRNPTRKNFFPELGKESKLKRQHRKESSTCFPSIAGATSMTAEPQAFPAYSTKSRKVTRFQTLHDGASRELSTAREPSMEAICRRVPRELLPIRKVPGPEPTGKPCRFPEPPAGKPKQSTTVRIRRIQKVVISPDSKEAGSAPKDAISKDASEHAPLGRPGIVDGRAGGMQNNEVKPKAVCRPDLVHRQPLLARRAAMQKAKPRYVHEAVLHPNLLPNISQNVPLTCLTDRNTMMRGKRQNGKAVHWGKMPSGVQIMLKRPETCYLRGQNNDDF